MPVPDFQSLPLPVLKAYPVRAEVSAAEVRERVALAEGLMPGEAVDRASRHVHDALLPKLVPGKIRVGDAEKYIRNALYLTWCARLSLSCKAMEKFAANPGLTANMPLLPKTDIVSVADGCITEAESTTTRVVEASLL